MKCLNCENEGVIPVKYAPEEIWSCDDCWPVLYNLVLRSKKKFICDLHNPVDKYVRKDGSTGKITKGKAWEIDNRVVGKEGKVINRLTKRETQY